MNAIKLLAATLFTAVTFSFAANPEMVRIGNQIWMKKNMDVNVPGSTCPEVNCKKYGRLYTWDAAKKVCPEGWHLPSKAEFETLLQYLDYDHSYGEEDSYYAKKILSKKSGGTDEYGLSVMLSGSKNGLIKLGESAAWWSSTEDNPYPYFLQISTTAHMNISHYPAYFSVRCIMDETLAKNENIMDQTFDVSLPEDFNYKDYFGPNIEDDRPETDDCLSINVFISDSSYVIGSYQPTIRFEKGKESQTIADSILESNLKAIHYEKNNGDVDRILIVFFGINEFGVSKEACLRKAHEFLPLVNRIKRAGFKDFNVGFIGYQPRMLYPDNPNEKEISDYVGLWYKMCKAMGLPFPTIKLRHAINLKYPKCRTNRKPQTTDTTKISGIAKLMKGRNGVVLKNVADHQTTELGGRKADEDLNKGNDKGGCGGIGDRLASLLGSPACDVAKKAKGNVQIAETDIIINDGNRPVEGIWKNLRMRYPGVRHIYKKRLKERPDFQGTVTLELTISPDGDIVDISISSSTTGFDEFDEEIKNAVRRWKFSKVKDGNTTVTLPFTFSE